MRESKVDKRETSVAFFLHSNVNATRAFNVLFHGSWMQEMVHMAAPATPIFASYRRS